MSGEASTSRVASACKPRFQYALQLQGGHHTSGSSLFETAYFLSSSRFKELDSTEPSPFPQISKVSLSAYFFMRLLAFSRLSQASSSKSCRDFANLYVAGLTLRPSCSVTSMSKGV